MMLLKILLNRRAKIICCAVLLAFFATGHTEESPTNSEVTNESESVLIMDSLFVRTEGDNIVDINIHYPQLSGHLVSPAVNKLLYAAAITEDDVAWWNGVFKHNQTYDIYIDRSIVSCLFKGYCDTGGTYADVKHTIVADWKTGKEYSLDTFVSIEKLLNEITAEELRYTLLLDSELQTPEIKRDVNEALIAFFSQDHPHWGDYYIKENVIGVIVYVPPLGMVCVEIEDT